MYIGFLVGSLIIIFISAVDHYNFWISLTNSYKVDGTIVQKAQVFTCSFFFSFLYQSMEAVNFSSVQPEKKAYPGLVDQGRTTDLTFLIPCGTSGQNKPSVIFHPWLKAKTHIGLVSFYKHVHHISLIRYFSYSLFFNGTLDDLVQCRGTTSPSEVVKIWKTWQLKNTCMTNLKRKI